MFVSVFTMCVCSLLCWCDRCSVLHMQLVETCESRSDSDVDVLAVVVAEVVAGFRFRSVSEVVVAVAERSESVIVSEPIFCIIISKTIFVSSSG